MTTTGLIKYMVVIVGTTAEGIINANYKVIIEILVKVYFKVIARRSAIFIKGQTAS